MKDHNLRLTSDDGILTKKGCEISSGFWKIRETTSKGAIIIFEIFPNGKSTIKSNFKIAYFEDIFEIIYDAPNAEFIDEAF